MCLLQLATTKNKFKEYRKFGIVHGKRGDQGLAKQYYRDAFAIYLYYRLAQCLVLDHHDVEAGCSSARPAIQSIPIIPPRGDGSGDVLAHPEGGAPHQRARLSLSHKRAVAALAEHLRKQSAASGDAEPVRLALAAAQEEAATYQKCPAPGRIQVRAINEGRSILVNLNEYDQGRSRATRNFGFVAIAKICAIFSQVESITKP